MPTGADKIGIKPSPPQTDTKPPNRRQQSRAITARLSESHIDRCVIWRRPAIDTEAHRECRSACRLQVISIECVPRPGAHLVRDGRICALKVFDNSSALDGDLLAPNHTKRSPVLAIDERICKQTMSGETMVKDDSCRRRCFQIDDVSTSHSGMTFVEWLGEQLPCGSATRVAQCSRTANGNADAGRSRAAPTLATGLRCGRNDIPSCPRCRNPMTLVSRKNDKKPPLWRCFKCETSR